jgi:hypothetical protein
MQDPNLLLNIINPHVLLLLSCNSFDDEVPSRFRKYIIKAIEEPDHQTFRVDSLNRILDNIGRHDAHLNDDELRVLLQEAGVPGNLRTLPISKMQLLMKSN